ncbi:MAG: RrF2 family transcriptional regulator [bacterium]|nr:RrF2 family transcriptional regulator [bacterium]
MKVSTKGRYGLRALVDLAVNSTTSHVSLVSIANRQKISLNYLEQVFASLRKAKIVKSVKGAQGGYSLGKPASQIKISEILAILEGEFNIVDDDIFEEHEIDSVRLAVKTLVWDRINENVNKYLDSTTLEDLANEYIRLNSESPEMYYI